METRNPAAADVQKKTGARLRYVAPEDIEVLPWQFAGAHTDGAVDVLFENARVPSLFWHVHGDCFYLRDSALARLFLREWLEHRCGFKDQYSLWHATLTLAGRAGCLTYDDEIYRNFTYQEARRSRGDVTPRPRRRRDGTLVDVEAAPLRRPSPKRRRGRVDATRPLSRTGPWDVEPAAPPRRDL